MNYYLEAFLRESRNRGYVTEKTAAKIKSPL